MVQVKNKVLPLPKKAGNCHGRYQEKGIAMVPHNTKKHCAIAMVQTYKHDIVPIEVQKHGITISPYPKKTCYCQSTKKG